MTNHFRTAVIALWTCLNLTSGSVRAGVTVSLAGDWRVRLDPRDQGAGEAWASRPLAGASTIRLPSTTDQAGLGHALDTNRMTYDVPFVHSLFPGVRETTRADERGFLVRERFYLGRAWYQRALTVPASWRGKHLRLRLERALWKTEVWVDGRSVGTCDSLVTDHWFDLGALEPGERLLSVSVDNRMVHNTGTIGHAYTPETQTRWNGVVGRIDLVATDPVFIRRIEAHPSPDRGSVRVVAEIRNQENEAAPGAFRARLRQTGGSEELAAAMADFTVPPGGRRAEITLKLPQAGKPWDEFSTALYDLEATWIGRGASDEARTRFGFRQIERDGPSLQLESRLRCRKRHRRRPGHPLAHSVGGRGALFSS